jgi:hypothetical protein
LSFELARTERFKPVRCSENIRRAHFGAVNALKNLTAVSAIFLGLAIWFSKTERGLLPPTLFVPSVKGGELYM